MKLCVQWEITDLTVWLADLISTMVCVLAVYTA